MNEYESILEELRKKTKEPYQEPQKKKKKEKKKNFQVDLEEVKENNIQTIFATQKKEGYFNKENQTVLVLLTKGKNKGNLVEKEKKDIKNYINNASSQTTKRVIFF